MNILLLGGIITIIVSLFILIIGFIIVKYKNIECLNDEIGYKTYFIIGMMLFITGMIFSNLDDNIGLLSFLFFGLIFLSISMLNINKLKVENIFELNNIFFPF
jgi:hypothetical protein